MSFLFFINQNETIMDRRQLLKSISLISSVAILSPKHLLAENSPKSLHYLGIGNGGCKMIEYLLKKEEAINYTVINSSFKGYNFPINKQVIYDLPNDAYNGRNINMATLHSQTGLPQNIHNIFADNSKHYVVFVGLGGYTGSYLSTTIISHLAAKNTSYNCIISLPFSHEGFIKRKNAEIIKSSLPKSKNIAFVDFDLIRKEHGNFKMVDAFEVADEYVNERYRKLN
jgi:cell division GTPase FtsZ